MQRREFFQLIASASTTYMVLKLTACGPALEEGTARVMIADGDSVVMYDIRMEGWSTLGSGFLGENGVLRATQIQDAKEISLNYVQDPHGHKFTIKREHFAKLRRGEKVSIMTTEAQGHHHEVRIDPKRRASGGQGISMPVNLDAAAPDTKQPDQGTPDTTNDDKIYAALDESNPSRLYVASSAEMDESSLQYCVDTSDRCASDATLWQTMQRHAPRVDKQIFASDGSLLFGSTATEQQISVRGKRKRDQRLLTFLLKLTKR